MHPATLRRLSFFGSYTTNMEGQQVILRALEATDLELLTRWNFDPMVTAFFSPRLPNTLTEQKEWMLRQLEGGPKKKFMIIDKTSKEAIGVLGMMGIDHVNKNAEIGITIGNISFWGKPQPKEAFSLVLQFLFQQFNMHMVYLQVFDSNIRAIRFFEKFGFRRDGIRRECVYAHGAYHSIMMMSLLKQEFEQIDMKQ